MLRRAFCVAGVAAMLAPGSAGAGEKLAAAARAQLGVTTGYDAAYTKMAYPMGDVPRSTGVCADVVIRAGRDALGADLQRLVHEDMARDFAAYPRAWGLRGPDTNIDHRRVLNLETFFRRGGAQVWAAKGAVSGDGFPEPLLPGDILTFMLQGNLTHVAVVVPRGKFGARIVHNIGAGVEENALLRMSGQKARTHNRWVGAVESGGWTAMGSE